MSDKKTLSSVLFVLLVFAIFPLAVFAELPELDKSPADIAYFRKSKKDAPVAKVIYSRPQKKDRKIFGELVPFGKVWRTGANESTEIDFYKDGTFGGKPVKAGRYSLFTIPNETS